MDCCLWPWLVRSGHIVGWTADGGLLREDDKEQIQYVRMQHVFRVHTYAHGYLLTS